jgi:superoxide dismutase
MLLHGFASDTINSESEEDTKTKEDLTELKKKITSIFSSLYRNFKKNFKQISPESQKGIRCFL